MSEPLTSVTPEEIASNSYAVAAFLNYLFWINDSLTIRPEQIAPLYTRWVRRGEDPWIVADELGLPKDPDW